LNYFPDGMMMLRNVASMLAGHYVVSDSYGDELLGLSLSTQGQK